MRSADRFRHWSIALRRIGLGGLFLWFGVHEIVAPLPAFESFVPAWGLAVIEAIPALTLATLIRIHGFIEVVFGLLLLVGAFARMAAVGLSVLLILIVVEALAAAASDIVARDLALLAMTLSVALYGSDRLSVDARWRGHI